MKVRKLASTHSPGGTLCHQSSSTFLHNLKPPESPSERYPICLRISPRDSMIPIAAPAISGQVWLDNDVWRFLQVIIRSFLVYSRAQMPYGGDIIRHDTSTNDESGVNTSANDGEDYQESSDWFGRVSERFCGSFPKCGICMRKISYLHALYQHQPVLGVPTTATDLVGI
jgi:hypothetical protein